MSLYLGATKGRKKGSQFIRWVTQESVNHILGLTQIDGIGWTLIEATKEGYFPVPATSRPDHATCLTHLFQLDPRYEKRVLKAIFAKAGRNKEGKPFFPYDWWLNLSWLFAGLGNRIAGRKKWRPALDTPDKLNCSEAYAEVFIEESVPGPWTSWMNPGEFLRGMEDSIACIPVHPKELQAMKLIFLGC